jgi:hypothetical protein
MAVFIRPTLGTSPPACNIFAKRNPPPRQITRATGRRAGGIHPIRIAVAVGGRRRAKAGTDSRAFRVLLPFAVAYMGKSSSAKKSLLKKYRPTRSGGPLHLYAGLRE